MSPRELMLFVDEYNARRQREREDMITQAYLIAAWHPRRTRRLPKLDKLLKDIRPKEQTKPQTPEQMLEIVRRMHAKLEKREGN